MAKSLFYKYNTVKNKFKQEIFIYIHILAHKNTFYELKKALNPLPKNNKDNIKKKLWKKNIFVLLFFISFVFTNYKATFFIKKTSLYSYIFKEIELYVPMFRLFGLYHFYEKHEKNINNISPSTYNSTRLNFAISVKKHLRAQIDIYSKNLSQKNMDEE